jgi:hypothetical protein
MHFRRLASFLLGLWIGGSLFMTMVATQNFRAVDRLLSAPGAAAGHIATLGPEAARALLRYSASENNRFFFITWEWAQILVGLVLIAVLIAGKFHTKTAVSLAAAMLAIAVLFRFFLTPQIVELGRSLDFQAPGMPPAERSRFRDFHGAYSALEVFKWILGLILLLTLVLPKRKSREVPDDLDAVEKAHYRHVDR